MEVSNSQDVPRKSGEIFSNLPSSTLENIAAFQPPPGVTANWENPDSHREILILIPTIMMSATGNGTLGLHNWDFPVSQLLSYRNLITTGLLPWLTPLTLGLVKTTIFLTYMEIFRSMKWVKMAVLIGLSFTAVWYSAITIAGICLTVPLGDEGWVKHLFTSRMIRQNALSIPTAVVGLAIDCYLFILPMIALNKLKMTRRKKLGAGLIFAIGLFAIVASVMSVVYRVIHGSEHGDNTWWLVPIMSVTCTGSRGENSVDFKSSQASDTVDDSKVSREKVRPPPKMYPGLDLTSRGGTAPATELDKNEDIPNSKENHKVDSGMEHTQVEKSPMIGENEIFPTRMYKAVSKPRVLIRGRPSTSRTTKTIEGSKFHTPEPQRYADPESKPLSKGKPAMSESKKTQNPSIGIDFKDLGATKTVRWVVIVAISVAATMETVFCTKMLMSRLGWGKGEEEEEEEERDEDEVKMKIRKEKIRQRMNEGSLHAAPY
ncbi:putative integral membrane protein [Botrytis fragariae]|uniref:Putative integral membrane protein n=1 Tax=Botrytis fragariae TaxID=1964551 RepID=A0A8H6AM68_9HELO|nr:putative integral membrane protein [Botrytis fragariae]KAF5869878.1 putative integral membrane protein [Botrytis fragariae]